MPKTIIRPTTGYSIELLHEYAHTLDSMPLDLSRIFADLRELDAVLTSTVASVTTKIYKLIEMIQDRSASNEQRLWLLGEIAEEASKIRPGADDKIRIATQAADSLHIQTGHLHSLVTHLPEFEPAMLVPKTRYPHVSARAYMPPHSFETGRRRRAPIGAGAWMGATESSPQKKRRVVQDEDLDYGTAAKTPRKEKNGETGHTRPRGGPRTKKVERHPSPPDSLHSIASHPPAHAANTNNANSNGTNHRSAGGTTHRGAHNNSNSNKRRANPQNGSAHAEGSLLESVMSRKDNQQLAPSSSTSHPSLVEAFDNEKRGKDYWPPETPRDLQVPSASTNNTTSNNNSNTNTNTNNNNKAPRTSTHSSLTTNLTTNLASAIDGGVGGSPAPGGNDAGAGAVATAASSVAEGTTAGDAGGDGDGEADDGRIYCFCDNMSFGEMIGCDQPGCKREWFHLSCVGLKEAPKGLWYCDECAALRKNPRNPRKKRAPAGGRANARNNGS
ncbi:uncharacterized protein FOMMEDRAFT_113764 [Fomitiporia mediterranea MF3/22]|uniref:uncharacterized protein n=1 Tax=Fomitiporia mediterranea (strain MF3/22) TaxID=694068 RepID=UPI0004409855|nr:uncharacterized protein FOMMEDRAFT_113764 [Fomitiporia mediterranea MF3/22]EJC98613.1 hypothetical protein FOMMEDRAFT_113764 [Fomitiporia mediterranea MF3/22]